MRHRMNVGAIVSPAMLSVRIASRRGGTPGRKIGEVEEGYLEVLEPGDTFVFAGQVWRLVGVTGIDVLVRPAPGEDAKMPSWGGSKFALSTFLAKKVRQLMSDGAHWDVLPDDVREWLEIQARQARRSRPRTRCCWRPSRTAGGISWSPIRSRGAWRTPPWPCC